MLEGTGEMVGAQGGQKQGLVATVSYRTFLHSQVPFSSPSLEIQIRGEREDKRKGRVDMGGL